MTYNPTIVNVNNPFPQHNGFYSGVTPTQTFFDGDVQCGVISVWVWGFGNPSFVDFAVQGSVNTGAILYFSVDHGGTVAFQAFEDVGGSATALIDGTVFSPLDPPSCPINVIISFDTLNGLLQAYMNDQPLTFTSPIKSAGLVNMDAVQKAVFGHVGGDGGATGYFSDLWFGDTGTFVDMTNPANRRKFIDASLKPVFLGTTGQIPFGYTPNFYLSVFSGGMANDWLTNRGLHGGVFNDNTNYGSFPACTASLELNGNPCSNPAPDGLICGVGATMSSIVAVWNDIGADSYNIQYRVSGTVTWTEIDGIIGASTTITGLLPGTEYEWEVQGVFGGTPTDWSVSQFCFTATAPFRFLSCENGWTITQPVTKIWGFDHLIGMDVVGLLDGVPFGPQVVATDGSVTLPFPASKVRIGLAFPAQLQLPYLDASAPTIQGRRKDIVAVTVRVDASNNVQIGTNQPDGSTQEPPAIAPTWTNMTAIPIQTQPSSDPQPLTYLSPAGQTVKFLQTGDLRQTVTAQWAKPGQIAVQQLSPLPLSVLAVIPELLEGDVTEQGYSHEEKPQQRVDGHRQHQGPGAWMLRK